LVLNLSNPAPALLPILAMYAFCVLPKSLIIAQPGNTVEDKVKHFMDHPIGSGPFLLTEWQRNQVMRLKRNPYYWKTVMDGKPLPYLDEIEFQIIPDDATRILKLQAGEIHGTEPIPYARIKELQEDRRLRVDLWPSTKRVFFVMNVRPTLNNGAPNPLSDVRVRRALNYAVSKEGVIQVATQGIGTPMRSFLSASVPLFYGPPQPYPYDPAKAKALLKEAGVAQGLQLSILILAGSLDESNSAVTVQQMWSQVGVELKIEQIEGATRNARWKAADFQMRYFGGTDDVGDPTEAGASAAYYPHNQSRRSGWQDKRSDELYIASEQSQTHRSAPPNTGRCRKYSTRPHRWSSCMRRHTRPPSGRIPRASFKRRLAPTCSNSPMSRSDMIFPCRSMAWRRVNRDQTIGVQLLAYLDALLHGQLDASLA
jgi:peptide/nickel transport system substrate-binding protein